MFDPEKLLGGLIRSGMRRGGAGGLLSGGAMLGLVGVAMAAAEHFLNRPGGMTGGTAPPPPRGAHRGGPPPPPPGPGGAARPPPPGAPAFESIQEDRRAQDAVLLIRAMIAAANADGVIDQDECGRIFDRLKEQQLSPEDQAFLMHELLAPQNAQAVACAAVERRMAGAVYEVSLLAIDPDTEKEQRYLQDLAHYLGLDDTQIASIHRHLGTLGNERSTS